MDCEACTEKMVELLYDELDEGDRESTRDHLSGCDACTLAYERLESGLELAAFLPMIEPPEGLLTDALALAAEKARERRGRDKAPDRLPAAAAAPEQRAIEVRDDADVDGGLWASLVHWIGSLAMRPQLAMAMTLLLMVGIGMWYLPELQGADPTQTHTIVDPTLGDEVAPSTTLEPAERLELRADPRTGRIRPLDAEDEAPTPVLARSDTPDHEPESNEGTVADLDESAGADDGVADEAYGPAEEGAEAVEAALPDDALAVLAPTARPESELGVPALQPSAAPATAPASAEGSPAADAVAPSQDPAREQYDRGLARYRQRDYRGAADDFNAVIRRPDTDPRRLLPQAMHQLARSRRGAGNCQTAVTTYEQLLSRYRTYSGAPEAMIEAGDCYRQLGRLSDARRWYTEAQRHEAVASRAQRAMTTVAAAERAHDEAQAEAADEPAEAPTGF